MEVELLVIPECPGTQYASGLLRAALDDVGLAEVTFTVRIIATEEEAAARRLAGSPAFVVDGTDLFDTEGHTGSLACRIYSTPGGEASNVPSLKELRAALQERARTA